MFDKSRLDEEKMLQMSRSTGDASLKFVAGVIDKYLYFMNANLLDIRQANWFIAKYIRERRQGLLHIENPIFDA